MKHYEALFILSPNLKPEQLESLTKEIQKAIETEEVINLSAEPPEKRPLAYPIKKSTEGFYVIYRFQAQPGALERIKAALKHKDVILRSLFTVKTEATPTPAQTAGETREP